MPAARSIAVLVVDDQQTMRGMARQCLKQIGVLDVALAASGEAALEQMMAKKFDVVISDLNMPGTQRHGARPEDQGASGAAQRSGLSRHVRGLSRPGG
jgi:CheY-like chemotaxis protein